MRKGVIILPELSKMELNKIFQNKTLIKQKYFSTFLKHRSGKV